QPCRLSPLSPHPLATFHPFFSLRPPPPRSTLFPYTTLFRSLSLHIHTAVPGRRAPLNLPFLFHYRVQSFHRDPKRLLWFVARLRSEEHTSELQSRFDLVCRLLLEKKNIQLLTYMSDLVYQLF